ncbi:MAG: hypothetical protein SFY68_12535 [Candidatus Sumerlaeia bacterium]|nr:hypothetical protein [Candidatus Sumerlaeia bacterium]
MTQMIGILRTPSSLPANTLSLNIGAALAQRGSQVLQLLQGQSATVSQTAYPRLSKLQGGTDQLMTGDASLQSALSPFNWVVYEVQSDWAPASISLLASKATHLILAYEESSLSLNALPQLLQPLAKLKAENKCPQITNFLVTKENSAAENLKKFDAACGTFATIKSLYPGIHSLPTITHDPDLISSSMKETTVLAQNPLSKDAEVFRTLATQLAPGTEGDAVVRRSLKRHMAGKPPAVDSFFDKLFDQIGQLFGGSK